MFTYSTTQTNTLCTLHLVPHDSSTTEKYRMNTSLHLPLQILNSLHITYITYSMFFFVKSTKTVPTAALPVSSLATDISALNSTFGKSAGTFPSGKQTSLGSGGLRMKSDPPGMNGTQYGSGCEFLNSSSFPS